MEYYLTVSTITSYSYTNCSLTLHQLINSATGMHTAYRLLYIFTIWGLSMSGVEAVATMLLYITVNIPNINTSEC